jgi:hypothetical protein
MCRCQSFLACPPDFPRPCLAPLPFTPNIDSPPVDPQQLRAQLLQHQEANTKSQQARIDQLYLQHSTQLQKLLSGGEEGQCSYAAVVQCQQMEIESLKQRHAAQAHQLWQQLQSLERLNFEKLNMMSFPEIHSPSLRRGSSSMDTATIDDGMAFPLIPTSQSTRCTSVQESNASSPRRQSDSRLTTQSIQDALLTVLHSGQPKSPQQQSPLERRSTSPTKQIRPISAKRQTRMRSLTDPVHASDGTESDHRSSTYSGSHEQLDDDSHIAELKAAKARLMSQRTTLDVPFICPDLVSCSPIGIIAILRVLL